MTRQHSLLVVLLLLPACAKDSASSGGSTGEEGSGSEASTGGGDESESSSATGDVGSTGPTFYGEVRPLFVEHCVGCHEPGGIGPFDLGDYETSKALADLITIATRERSMPPFNASNTGECHTFRNARWLEDDEIETIEAWAEAGAPAGDPAAPQPEPPPSPTLEGEDVIAIGTPADYHPVADAGSELDDYQCFLGQIGPADSTRFVTGYEVLPGNAALAHHLIGFLVDLDGPAQFGSSNREVMQSLDDATPDQPGWDCFGSAGDGVLVDSIPLAWAPGSGAVNLPAGVGIRIEPGYALVVQMHYNLVNGSGADQTRVRLATTDEVEREAIMVSADRFLGTLFDGVPAAIPPGDPSWMYSWDQRLSSLDSRIAGWDAVEIFGVLPHMHELGRRMEVTFIEGTATDPIERCGLWVDRWDFDWQSVFVYEEPVVVEPSTLIQVTCEWDSSTRTAPTNPGLGSQDEMCLFGVYATEAR